MRYTPFAVAYRLWSIAGHEPRVAVGRITAPVAVVVTLVLVEVTWILGTTLAETRKLNTRSKRLDSTETRAIMKV